ncbi:MAG: dipeptidase PepV, partial [Anaeroplasmataceae bacterium]|nr:dipeptidase PepV [Anaeroplasmataceae bacterium]
VEDYVEEGLLLLSKLISYNTVLEKFNEKSDAPFGDENKHALKFILDYAEHDGFLTKNDKNYAGHIEFGKGKEILGILAHLDVVPVDGQSWKTNPFVLHVEDGKLIGRGTMDDKGPLVTAYLAMKLLKDQGFTPKKKVRLIMGCDEESGSRCLAHYFKKNEVPDLGFSPDAEFPLIYGEKAHMTFNFEGKLDDTEIITEFTCGTRYNVVPALASMKLKKNYKKEYLSFLEKNNYQGKVEGDTYYAYGVASHAMVPQNGLNASFILFEFLNEVSPSTFSEFFVKYLTFDPFGKKLGYDLYDEEMKELTSNVGLVHIKDGSILIGIDCRVPRKEHENVMKDKIAASAKTANLKANVLGFGGFHYVDPNSFLVTTLMKVYKEVTGDTAAEPITIGGGTYAKFIENGVAFGPLMPGREDVCHIADEYMLLEDFKNAILIYAKAIYELS